MGGLPCAKVIIDNQEALFASLDKATAALSKALGCMRNSILIEKDARQPTYEMQHEFEAATAKLIDNFQLAAEPLARIAAEIERYVSTGETTYNNEDDVRKVLDQVAPPGEAKPKKPERPFSKGGAPWKPGSGGPA